jgi:hypothetical protein
VSLFTAPQNLPFGIAFALIVGIALLEGLGHARLPEPEQPTWTTSA